MGVLTLCTPSLQVKLPKQKSVLYLWLVVMVTVKEICLAMELKTKVSGFTDMVIPGGDSMIGLYLEFTGPTLVTVLVTVIEFLRLGMVTEGRFRSRREGFLVGHDDGFLVRLLMEVEL